jgi:hypothetical protein
MPTITRNSYYYDPAMASAFNNLASAFAPPSGTDVYAYTKAGSERQKAQALADLLANPNDPDFDRKNIVLGNLTGLNTIAAQNQNDATVRRGQDVSAGAQRDVAGINNAGALARLYATPTIVGDGQTAYLPQQTQAATGLGPTLAGNVTVNQGQRVVQPGGGVVEGAQKPLNDSEVTAQIIQSLTPQEQRAYGLRGVGITNVAGANGPVAQFSPDAVGKPVYEKDARQPQIANFKTPDGRVGTAMLDPNSGRWKETQTGAELPAGTQTYTANLQGDKMSTGLGASTQNNVDSMLVDLALAQDTSKQLRSLVTKNPAVQGLAGNIRGTVQDMIQAGGEVGQLFNVNMDKMKQDIASGNIDPEVAQKFANFDPNIPATAMLETLLTAQVAKVLDPNGRISNDRYNQVAKALGNGGLTGNTAKTLATLDQLDKIIESRRAILGPQAPVAAKVGQGVATAAPAAGGRLKFNPATGQIE